VFAHEEQRALGEANACQHVSDAARVGRVVNDRASGPGFGLSDVANASRSIRFAPPLVISEEDLRRAIKIIGESLAELDEVGGA
jgi:4-aminobutyrate aminotransferase-like enzyme